MRHSPELIRSLMHVVRLAVNHFRSQGNRHHGDMRPNPSTHRAYPFNTTNDPFQPQVRPINDLPVHCDSDTEHNLPGNHWHSRTQYSRENPVRLQANSITESHMARDTSTLCEGISIKDTSTQKGLDSLPTSQAVSVPHHPVGSSNQPFSASQPYQPFSASQPYQPFSASQPYQPFSAAQPYQPFSAAQPYQPFSASQPYQPFSASQPYQPFSAAQPYQPFSASQPYQPFWAPFCAAQPYQPFSAAQPYQPFSASQPYQPFSASQPYQPFSASQPYQPFSASQPYQPSSAACQPVSAHYSSQDVTSIIKKYEQELAHFRALNISLSQQLEAARSLHPTDINVQLRSEVETICNTKSPLSIRVKSIEDIRAISPQQTTDYLKREAPTLYSLISTLTSPQYDRETDRCSSIATILLSAIANHRNRRANGYHMRGVREHLRASRYHMREVREHLRASRHHMREVREHLRASRYHMREVREHLRASRYHMREVREHLRASRYHMRGVREHLRLSESV
ncbi:hypothetical protein Bbelb_349990 [Branchiostoma belcheri]|nr:hypothetical protein Bbelb_349990 [Branchiostoma belcheri]